MITKEAQPQPRKDLLTDFGIFNLLYNLFWRGKMATLDVVTPTAGGSVIGGSVGQIVVTISQTDFWNILNSCTVSVYTEKGEKMWQGSGKFKGGEVSLQVTWPLSPGKYVVAAQGLSVLGFVNSEAKQEFTVVGPPPPKAI